MKRILLFSALMFFAAAPGASVVVQTPSISPMSYGFTIIDGPNPARLEATVEISVRDDRAGPADDIAIFATLTNDFDINAPLSLTNICCVQAFGFEGAYPWNYSFLSAELPGPMDLAPGESVDIGVGVFRPVMQPPHGSEIVLEMWITATHKSPSVFDLIVSDEVQLAIVSTPPSWVLFLSSVGGLLVYRFRLKHFFVRITAPLALQSAVAMPFYGWGQTRYLFAAGRQVKTEGGQRLRFRYSQ